MTKLQLVAWIFIIMYAAIFIILFPTGLYTFEMWKTLTGMLIVIIAVLWFVDTQINLK